MLGVGKDGSVRREAAAVIPCEEWDALRLEMLLPCPQAGRDHLQNIPVPLCGAEGAGAPLLLHPLTWMSLPLVYSLVNKQQA